MKITIITKEIGMIKNLKDEKPTIHENTFIAETAVVLGKARVGEGSSIWYGTVLRGDIAEITVGNYTNIQDNSVIHTENNVPASVGDYTVVGHKAIIHGAKVGNNCLVGMGAIILNRAKIGDNCIIAAGSIVTEGKTIPDDSMVMGIPGRVVRRVTEDEKIAIRNNALRYNELWKQHLD
ncbi:MAG: gamma carbonic anhydrase family protein [Gudongella sp.]|nr:gamma carbonic anhydrase family protein [Gudongella sp.]